MGFKRSENIKNVTQKKNPEKNKRKKNVNSVSSIFCQNLENVVKTLRKRLENVENAPSVFYTLAENVFFSFFADHFLVSKIR